MKILKYKKISSNKYRVYLDNNENIILHENIIIKYNLLIEKEITNLNSIMIDNNNYLLYDETLSYISKKMRCEFEIRNYLNKKEVSNDIIEQIINKLKKDGFLNEKLFVKSYISDKMRLSKNGINKIKSDLIKLNIDKKVIEDEIKKFDLNESNNILEKLIDKKIRSNKSYGPEVLKQKLLIEFINKGYDKQDIIQIIESKDISCDNIYEKEYQKLYNKYSKKYSGSELDYFIKQKLFQKGLKK